MNKTIMLFTVALLGTVTLPGCADTSGEEEELAGFSATIADFADYLQEADMQINNLDASKQESVDELLEILDQMEAEFAVFSMIQAPDQYESVSGLAVQASDAMKQAVSCYHTAYESEVFDSDYADAAYKYYSYSMKVCEYIGMFLLGESLPEDASITVYEVTNDENILDRWLSGSKEDETDVNEYETTSE